MKAEDLYDEIRRKLGTVAVIQGGIGQVSVDVKVEDPGEDTNLTWDVCVTPVDGLCRRIAGTYPYERPVENEDLGEIADLKAELARVRGQTTEVENELEDAVRELDAMKEFGCAVRNRLPDTRQSITRKFKIARPGHTSGDLSMYVTVGLYPDGRPGEIFIRSDRTGSFASGALDAVAMVLSVAWQYGVPFEPTVAKLRGMRFEPQGASGDSKYGIVKSPLDYVARWLLDRFVKEEGS